MTQPIASSSSAPTPAINSQQSSGMNEHITEDEASLYDRQIRLWGLEAQNRMRSSTVLVLSLRSISHELIKNIVLAGIGRLIVMDDAVVTEEDLGGGFLFREEEGAVGQERVTAAAPQITSLNPLVGLTVLPTLAPFVRDQSATAQLNDQQEMAAFLQRERVDVVIACDMTVQQMESVDAASRVAGTKFYGAGTYGYFGYVFADLGVEYDYIMTPNPSTANPSPVPTKKRLAYPSLSSVLDGSNWSLASTESAQGGSPYRGLTRSQTKYLVPSANIGVLAVWDFQRKHSRLPSGSADQGEIAETATRLRTELGVNPKSYKTQDAQELYESTNGHLSQHATHFFPPTLAIVGGFLAQDVLRALSKKDTPIVNFLVIDSMGATGVATRWGMGESVDI